MEYSIIIYQMAILFAFIIVGIFVSRKKMVDDTSAKSISKLIANVFNPALIMASVVGQDAGAIKDTLGVAALIAVVTFAINIVLAFVMAKIFAKNEDEKKMFKVMTVFSNIGFIGIPLVRALYGGTAVIYVAIFILLYNVLLYTYGVSVLQGHAGAKKSGLLADTLKKILNVGTLSCVAAIIIFLFDIPIPTMAGTIIQQLGNVATPLALMAIGFSLGHTNVREILFNKRLYAFSVLKLIVIPAVSILILKAIPLPGNLFGVTAALLAMPVGNMPLILSVEYDVDGKVCSEGIILSTILSMATLPLVMGLV